MYDLYEPTYSLAEDACEAHSEKKVKCLRLREGLFRTEVVSVKLRGCVTFLPNLYFTAFRRTSKRID